MIDCIHLKSWLPKQKIQRVLCSAVPNAKMKNYSFAGVNIIELEGLIKISSKYQSRIHIKPF